MNRARSSAAAMALALAGCVSEGAAAKNPESVEMTAAAKGRSQSAAEHEQDFAQALRDIDKQVDSFVGLSQESGDEARNKRNELARAVGAQVKRFKGDVLAAAGDASNPVWRAIAAKALGFCDDPAAVTALCAMLGVKGDVRLLTNATYSLGRLRSPLTRTDLLLPLVRDGDPDVRSNALLALARAFDAKRAIGASPLDPLEQRDAMMFLEPALCDPADPLIRGHAAAAVGALGDPRAVDPLLDLLRDDHPFVRMQTAIALGKLGDAKAVPGLVKAIDATPAGTPRRTVILALSALLEKLGHTPPDTLGDEGRAWARWVRDAMGEAEK